MDWEYDPRHPDFNTHLHAAFQKLREGAPVHYWSAEHTWLVSRHADVVNLMRDRRFSVNMGDWRHAPQLSKELMESPFMRLQHSSFMARTDADHSRLRRLVSPAFTPRAVERLRPMVQRIVDDLLAPFKAGDTMDLAESFAEKLPVRAISSMLGIPPEHDLLFRRFSYAILTCSNPMTTGETFAAANVDIAQGVEMLTRLIEERRRAPGEDLLSTLLHYEEQGDRLSYEELLSLVSAMISAGAETTTHLICLAVFNLLRHPQQLALLLADPTLIGSAIDELLRYDNIGWFGAMPRYAREDVELGGVTSSKGDQVVAVLTSAQRDESVFPDAERLDLMRDPQNNIPFGVGPHHCLGAALARLEGAVGLGTLLQRFPTSRIAGEPILGPHPFIRRITHLPLLLGA
jgi:cytochrome P450